MKNFPRHDFEASDPTRLVARPTVSVGVITYNHERFLAQALDSVLAQRTDFPFEVVVHEDRSTDSTLRIALDHQRRHPDRVRVLHSARNLGVGENARRGVAAYRGRYAAGLDGDDYWTDEGKLQKQFDALEARPELNLCFTRAAAVYADGTRRAGWDYGARDRLVSRRELLRTPGMTVPTSSCFFRTSALHGAPDWVFEAPVIDLFHVMAGATPHGAWYLAAETAAYRAMSPGSWTSGHAAAYHRAKLDHSRRMLDSLAAAQEAFGVPDRELALLRGLPRYVLGREALAGGDWRTAAGHLRRVGARYAAARMGQKLGLAMGRKEPGA